MFKFEIVPEWRRSKGGSGERRVVSEPRPHAVATDHRSQLLAKMLYHQYPGPARISYYADGLIQSQKVLGLRFSNTTLGVEGCRTTIEHLNKMLEVNSSMAQEWLSAMPGYEYLLEEA